MTDAVNSLIGKRIRFYRTTRGMSLEQLASRFHEPISGQQLAKYETGISRWPADLVIEIARIMRLDIRLLTKPEEDKPEYKDKIELEAERYKRHILSLSEKARGIVYRIIDGIINL